jgi:hypothetical protein
MQPLAAPKGSPYLLLRVPSALQEFAEVQVRHGIKALCWACCQAAENAAARNGHRKQPSSVHRCCLLFCCEEELSRFVGVEMYKNVRGRCVVGSRWKLLGWVWQAKGFSSTNGGKLWGGKIHSTLTQSSSPNDRMTFCFFDL